MASKVKPKVLIEYSRYMYLTELEEQIREAKKQEIEGKESSDKIVNETDDEVSEGSAKKPDMGTSYAAVMPAENDVSQGVSLKAADVRAVYHNLSKRLHNMAETLFKKMERTGEFALDEELRLYYRNEELGNLKDLVHEYLNRPEILSTKNPKAYAIFKDLLPRRIHHKKSERARDMRDKKPEKAWYKLQ